MGGGPKKIKQGGAKPLADLERWLILPPAHAHARTSTRTHARTSTRTRARPHAHTRAPTAHAEVCCVLRSTLRATNFDAHTPAYKTHTNRTRQHTKRTRTAHASIQNAYKTHTNRTRTAHARRSMLRIARNVLTSTHTPAHKNEFLRRSLYYSVIRNVLHYTYFPPSRRTLVARSRVGPQSTQRERYPAVCLPLGDQSSRLSGEPCRARYAAFFCSVAPST
jgi:hypothetical protein